MILSQRNIALSLSKHQIQLRPNAGQGIWLMFLLPVAIIISAVTHPVTSSAVYKLASIFSVGLIFSSAVFLYDCSQNIRLKCFNTLLVVASFTEAVFFHICYNQGLWFSLWSALVSTFLYYKLYLLVLEKLPKCFTLGEASVFAQSYITLLYFTILNIFNAATKPATSVMLLSTLIIQLTLVGLSTLFFLIYQFNITSPSKFYSLTALTFALIIFLPLQILMKRNPLLWILNLFWEDISQNKISLYWVFFTVLAVAVVNWRIKKAKKANTSVRKFFHFLIVAVYIPGLLYNCSLLYLASGMVVGIFFMLQVLRILNMPPLAETLQNGMVIFADEKDSGIIAFTPMYLLAGCSLPLWIHPSPCDVTNSAIFTLLPLLSGLLTIGIGDTAASIIGSRFGTHHWKGSKKTLEGTVACIVSQLLVILWLTHLDLIKLHSSADCVRVFAAITITSIIEAKTDQIDNLVLPFVMYIILIL